MIRANVEPFEVSLSERAPHWRYDLHVEIPGTEAAVLVDALEGEPFGLRARLGSRELDRQLAELELSVHATSWQRWEDFEADLQILSIYLSQDVVGRETHVQPTAGAATYEAWTIVARRGLSERHSLDMP